MEFLLIFGETNFVEIPKIHKIHEICSPQKKAPYGNSLRDGQTHTHTYTHTYAHTHTHTHTHTHSTHTNAHTHIRTHTHTHTHTHTEHNTHTYITILQTLRN